MCLWRIIGRITSKTDISINTRLKYKGGILFHNTVIMTPFDKEVWKHGRAEWMES